MANQIVVSAGAKVRNLDGVLTGTSGVVNSLPINASNGIPQLDVNGKILVSQLPNSVMEYQGTWNANTNTPTLVNGTGNQGDVYLCNVAGTVDFGAGPIAFVVGDQVIYSGSIWQRASGATGTVTSVAITESGDSLNITGSPITTNGTINIGFNGTNLQYVNGAGNLTTFPTLITSIGLSMPSAFSVANSPLTANGTIAVTGAGYPSQYIRGDGTLADFPSSGGGGSSVSYYLNGGTSQGTIGGTTYYEMSKTADTGTGVDFTKSGDGFIVAFLTDANDPAQLNIPAGNWNYEIYASMSANGGTPQMYAELYKYDGTTFTLISTSTNEILYDGTNLNLYTFGMTVPATTLTLTDRLAIKLYATNSGGKTTTVHTQDSHLCQVITTFSTGITALNGLTAQVQYFATGTSGTDFNISSTTATHTFNLPTASATNRGALSSADWSTFNGKENTLTFYSPLVKSGSSVTIPPATSIANGYLTSTDWSTFNSKQAALSGTGFVKISGTTISYDNSTYALDSDVVKLTGNQTIGGTKTFSLATKNNSGILLSDTSSTAAPSGYISLAGYNYLTNKGLLINLASQTYLFLFNTAAGNNYTFPNATGTIALTSDLTGGTVTSVAALTIGTSGTDLSSSVANSTTTPVITLNVPTASATNRGALSSADWTTFNNKQSALTNPVTGTGTTNYLPKFTGTSTIGDSAVSDDGTTVTLNSRALKFSADTWNTSGDGLQRLYFSANSNTYLKGAGVIIRDNNDLNILTLATGGLATFSGTVNTPTKYTWGTANDGTTGQIATDNTNNYLDFKGNLYFRGAAASNTLMTLNSSGNLGLGVTPSAWGSPFTVFQLGTYGQYVAGQTNTADMKIGTNNYYSAGTFYYTVSGLAAARYDVGKDGFFWNIAPSGTANTGISFTQAMSLVSSGNVLIGTTTDSGYKLDVNGTGRFSDVLNLASTTNQTKISWLGYNSAYTKITSDVGYDATYNGTYLTNNTNSAGNAQGNTAIPSWQLALGGSDAFKILRSAAGSFSFSTLFNLSNAGAATFSSSVTAASGIFTQSAGTSLQALQTSATNSTTAVIRQTGAGGNGSQDIGLLVDIQGANDQDRIVNFRYYDGTNYNSRFVVQRGGNVGIGTSSPSSKLTSYKTVTTNIGATGNAGLALVAAGSAGEYNLIQFGYDSESWQPAYIGYHCTSGAGSSNGDLVFGTRGVTTNSQPTERMRITSGGNVEIASGSIKTGTPSGGTAKPWKLGQDTSTLYSATRTIQVEIDGGTYYLLAVKSTDL